MGRHSSLHKHVQLPSWVTGQNIKALLFFVVVVCSKSIKTNCITLVSGEHSMDKKRPVHRVNRKMVTISGLLILALVLLEFLAHNYVQVIHLPVIAEEKAVKLIPFYHNYTYTFSSEGARWLVALRIKNASGGRSPADVYLFKVEQNASFLVQRIDLLVLGIRAISNVTGAIMANMDDIINSGNYTVVQIRYDVSFSGIFQVDFGLLVRVYQETLLGLIAKDEIRVPVNITLTYG